MAENWVVDTDSETFTPGKPLAAVLKQATIPADCMVQALGVEVEATLSNPDNSLAATTYPSRLAVLFQMLQMQAEFFELLASGVCLLALQHAMFGHTVENGVVTIAHNASAVVRFNIPISLADVRAKGPQWSAIPGSFLADATLQVNYTGVASLPSDDASPITLGVDALLIRGFAICSDPIPTFTPARQTQKHETWGGQTAQLEAADSIYSDIILFTQDESLLTLDDVSFLSLWFDGLPVLGNVRTQHVVYAYDQYLVSGGQEDMLTEQVPAAGGGSAPAFDFLPIWTPPNQKYVLQQLRAASSTVLFQFSGDLVENFTVGVRRFSGANAKQQSGSTRARVKAASPNHPLAAAASTRPVGGSTNAKKNAILQQTASKTNARVAGSA